LEDSDGDDDDDDDDDDEDDSDEDEPVTNGKQWLIHCAVFMAQGVV
jgi:hypothetical protein